MDNEEVKNVNLDTGIPVINNELEQSKDIVDEIVNTYENVEESSNNDTTESDTEDTEEPREEIVPANYDTMSYNALKALATDKGLEFIGNIKKVDLIEMLKVSDTELPPVNNNEDNTSIPVVTLDNKPVSPIVVEKDDEVVPQGFVQLPPKKEVNKHGIYNGRVYKTLTNGRAMYADNGETFDLSIIK